MQQRYPLDLPEWYRGPAEPYLIQLCRDLRFMRDQLARLSQTQMAEALTEELGRKVHHGEVGRWEVGGSEPSAGVYRAYMVISGAALPTDLDGDPRASLARQMMEIRREVGDLRSIVRGDGVVRRLESQDEIPLGDRVKIAEAARRLGVTAQTIRNRFAGGRIRRMTSGRRAVLVSWSDCYNAAGEREQRRANGLLRDETAETS